MLNVKEMIESDDNILTQQGFDLIFNEARTYNAWQDKDVSDEQLQQIYDLTKMGPTSANCSPARFIFVKSKEAKEKLKPHLAEGNVDKTMAAPVTVIVGQDTLFYNKLPELFPHADAKSWFDSNEDFANETAFRNATLQGAYFIIAARSLGLDTGPMSGFDKDGVDETFFKNTSVKSNFLINLGYGSEEGLFPRAPRLSFDEATDIL